MKSKKYQSKSGFFSRNFESTQNVEMKSRSRSWSPMKVDQTKSDNLSQTFHIHHLIKEEIKSDNYEGSESKLKWVFLLWRWYG